MGESSAGYRDECSAPARRQYHYDSGQHSPDAAQLTSLPKSVKVAVLSIAPHQYSRFRARYPDLNDAGDRAGRHDCIYLFLRNIPATIIPGVAVPLCRLSAPLR